MHATHGKQNHHRLVALGICAFAITFVCNTILRTTTRSVGLKSQSRIPVHQVSEWSELFNLELPASTVPKTPEQSLESVVYVRLKHHNIDTEGHMIQGETTFSGKVTQSDHSSPI